MATISKMSAIVTANISGFTAGMREAGESAGGFGERFKAVAESVAEAATILGVSFSAESIVEYLKHTFEAIGANERLAVSLGVSTQALGKLQYAAGVAGVSMDTLNSGLTKMMRAMDQARDGEKNATEAFQKLGLSAQDFVGLSADQAFAKIAESINHSTDRAAALNAAFSIFGRTAGAEIIPLLAQGKEGLDEMAEAAVKSGYALNDLDSAKVEVAEEAFNQLKMNIQGAANVLIVQMAPYLSAIAKKLVELTNLGGGFSETVVSGFKSVSMGAASLTDLLSLLKAGFYVLQGTVAGILYGITYQIDEMAKAISWLWEKMTGKGLDTSFIDGLTEGLKEKTKTAFKDAGQSWDDFVSGKTSKEVKRFFADIENSATQSAKAIEEAHKKMEGLGRFAEGEEKKGKEDPAIKKMQDEAKKLYEETRTPLEKFQAQLAEINKLYQGGYIDLDTYSRAINKAEADLKKATDAKQKFHRVDLEAPQLLEKGSQAAAEFAAKIQQHGKEDAENRKLAEEARKQTALQEAMVKKLENGGTIRIVDAMNGVPA